MLRILMGRAGSGKTTAVLNRLCQAAQERPQVLMTPEQQSHEAERALCKVGGPGISLRAEVLSFSRLANRVFQAAGGLGLEELDGGGRLLLMYRAVQETAQQLKVYGRPSKRPAFLQSLLATVDELKSCRVSPEQLIRAGEEAEGPGGDKLTDLGLICGAYEALVAQTALDPRDRLTRAADKLTRCPWARGKDLWLDGFTDFTPQQQEVLRHLLRQANQVTVPLTCDHLEEDEGGTGIFSPARLTAARLLRLAAGEGISCEVEHLVSDYSTKPDALKHLEQALFGHEDIRPVPQAGAVELFRASSPRAEVEWAAARTLRLARDSGLRFRDIGVVARNYGAYRDLIESIFPRFGIPVFSSAMSDILEKPVLALVTAALDTVAGNYAYDDVFRYLKTGLTDLPQEDRDLLENYVLEWDIRGSAWTQDRPWAWHPRGYGFPWEEADRTLAERLDAARRDVAKPLEELRRNANKTGRGQAIALYTFLEEIGLPERLAQRVEELNRDVQEKLQAVQNVFDNVSGGLTALGDKLGRYQDAIQSTGTTLGGAIQLSATLRGDLGKLSDDVERIVTSDGFRRFLDVLENNPEELAGYLSDPIAMETVPVYEITTYGSAMAPYYIMLALFVGSLLTATMIHVNAPIPPLPLLRPWQRFFGRYQLFFLVGMVQALVTGLGCVYYIGMQCLHPGLFLLACCVCSLNFTMMNFALVYALDNIGMALSVIIMVIQVAGSGGSYPIDVLPEVFQKLYVLMPFHYGMDMIRETIAGRYENVYWTNLAVMAGMCVLFAALGMLLYYPARPLNRLIARSKEKSGIM